MFPLLAVLNRDDNRGYSNPCYGLLFRVQGLGNVTRHARAEQDVQALEAIKALKKKNA